MAVPIRNSSGQPIAGLILHATVIRVGVKDGLSSLRTLQHYTSKFERNMFNGN